MKYILTLAFYSLLTPAVFAGLVANTFLANFNGTAYKQETVGSDTRVTTSAINTQRVFDEFGVSPSDYALVLNITGTALVSLVPKSASSGLPTLKVVEISSARSVINNKTGAGLFETPVFNSTAGGNIFRDLRGTMFGTIKLHPETERLLRFTGNVTGSSGSGPVVKAAEPKGALPGDLLLKFKVTKGAPFTQAP